MQIKAIELVYNGISTNKLLNHLASDLAFSKAINFLTMQVYLDDFQETAPPASVNTYPLVSFTSSMSEIQLASHYPSNIARWPQYDKP